jgi:hypothetical protein
MEDRDVLELRARQKQETIDRLNSERAIEEREQQGLLRQYVDLAHRHDLVTIDPVNTRAMPVIDQDQDNKARRLHKSAVVASGLGSIVFGGLSIVALAIGTPTVVFLGSIVFALGVSVTVVTLMVFITAAGPRNPKAEKPLKLWAAGFGSLMFVSIAVFAWLRFVSDPVLLDFTAYTIAGFEIGMFGLAAAFESASRIYGWSREITTRFNELGADIAIKRGTIVLEQQDLDELKFRIDARKQTPDIHAKEEVTKK